MKATLMASARESVAGERLLQALDRRAQLCMLAEEPQTVEELRATAQHQPAVRPSDLLGNLAQKTLNRF